MNPIARLASGTRDLLWRATRHWISSSGVFLAAISGISFLAMFALELSGRDLGPYTGIISYLILPGLFVLGLLMVPLGLLLLRRRERKGASAPFPILDFNSPRVRTISLVVVLLTVLNFMVASTATFKGLEVLHGDQFCGQTCHSVMAPEADTHPITAHANVYCADCHVGEGAGHFAKSKLRGVTQMWQFITGDVKRPAPQPTEIPMVNCTRCHAANRYVEDKLKIRHLYGEDEKSAEKITVYRMLIGGRRDGQWSGIHKHNGMKIRYLSDHARTTITEVEVTRVDGSTDKYVAKDAPKLEKAEWREMECTDCHNRPAHNFQTPQAIVEKALGRGAIDKELPFIYREAVAALSKRYSSHEEAKQKLPADLMAFYTQNDPGLGTEEKKKVEAAGQFLATEWTHNNFPQMNVAWNTYNSFLGHEPGCYRCHDKNHANAKGEVIQKKCDGTCHTVISTEEEHPEAIDVLYP